MSKKHLLFFATREDLLSVLMPVASKVPICFVKAGSFDCGESIATEPLESLSDLSVAKFGDQSREDVYLIIRRNCKPRLRTVMQRDGNLRYFFDQLSHPESVVLKPGGVFGNFDCIIAGQIGAISTEAWSSDLLKLLFSEIRKRFKKIKSYYVGEEARSKLDRGVRLTTNFRSPPEYDLRS